VEQHRVDAFLNQPADGRGFYVGDIECSGQGGEAVATVGVRSFFEIVADQLELGVARTRIDEVVEQLRESAHRDVNA